MKISGDWIAHPGTQNLLQVLETAGYRGLFVGGCVRNALMGFAVNDVDIATDALPQTVTNLAESAGFRVIPTGLAHGTVTVIAAGQAHEVTTFRQDVATDGRHAVVAFTDSVALDAARRDFTMNALYADAEGNILDPLDGLGDVMARRVRFVGDAQARIREDYLRILRFFRFYAVYGDQTAGIDAEGLAACAANADGIDALSAERVGAEMRKLLAAANPAPAISSMAQAGMLARVLPEADATSLAPLVHLESGIAPRWQRRLVVIGGQDVATRLCLSRAETAILGRVRDVLGTVLSPAALGWRLGAAEAEDAVLCRAALLQLPLPMDWRRDIDRGKNASLPVTAADLMPALTGPALGDALRQIEQRWLASDLTLTKDELLA